ncbi:MAG: hypothetical protein FRX48_06320 [Lasallia pustulata]|uniref:DUF1772-domain-containing protein n=1 Tax=Lasallia pustulata TaxID=136370 RepID=A0A5M8PLF2_9LECA|nr:MAG: hypothetical protein FRX48_06320 [Lasallia pustulata]
MAHFLYKPLLIASITASAILTGNQFSLSYVSVASILRPPTVAEVHLLSMFRGVFLGGFHLCPPLAFFSGLVCYLNAFLSYWHESGSVVLEQASSSVIPLLVAGSFMMGIVPFTLYMIVPVEEILLEKEAKLAKTQKLAAGHDTSIDGEAEAKGSAAETRRLLKRWAKLNYVRTIFPLVGLVVAWSILF